MTNLEFRSRLRAHLEAHADTVLLRIAMAPEWSQPVEFTGRALLEQAAALARSYPATAPSEVVLLLLPHSLELFLLHFGLILDGRLPAILAWPTTRIDPEKYQRNLLYQLRNLPAGQLLTTPQLGANLAPGLPFPVQGCRFAGAEEAERNFAAPIDFRQLEPHPQPGAPAPVPEGAIFLQFSGGTTGAQKAVVVTASMLERQLARLAESLDFSHLDSVVSWLPMYHDMGLIACLWFPLWFGAPSVQFAASDWLLQPGLLFQYIQRYRGTFCWLPNFALSYLAAQKERAGPTADLSSMRGYINCSEPVRLRSMRSYEEAYRDWGVRPEHLQASYAMAENVFAVTQTVLGAAPATRPRAGLLHATAEYSERAFDLLDDVYVSSGGVLRGMEVRIAGSDGSIQQDDAPGEIQIRTESLFCGYWSSGGFRAETITVDGWYSTGDYGFLDRGELYVIGRLKDIIIVGGQNLFPEDVEAIVNTVPQIYPGRVVAFGLMDEQLGTEVLTIIAEMRGKWDEAAAGRLEKEIRQLVLATIGVAPRYVRVAPERWIVKSTAGKISRRETRARYAAERASMQE